MQILNCRVTSRVCCESVSNVSRPHATSLVGKPSAYCMTNGSAADTVESSPPISITCPVTYGGSDDRGTLVTSVIGWVVGSTEPWEAPRSGEHTSELQSLRQ